MNATQTNPELIPVICGRCGGSGYWARGHWNQGGVCFACQGTGILGYTTQDELDAKAERAAKRTAAKARKVARIVAKAEAVLEADAELAAALETDHDIVADIKARLFAKGEISDKQRALVIKLAGEVAGRAAAKAEREAGYRHLEAGRQELAGKILSVKSRETPYGLSLKMLVELADGSGRVFGTLPSSLPAIDLRGKSLVFSANVEPKELGFGFFSRPTKAQLVD